MFFIVSKILAFITTPVMWIILLLAIAVFTKNARRKKIFLIGSFSVLLIFTNPFFFWVMCKMWEIEVVSDEERIDKYDVGIVLSGMMAYDEQDDRILFNGNVNRITHAIKLYRDGRISKIFISGGSGSVTYQEKSEAAILKRFLVNTLKIAEEDILIETLSNNTHENAVFTAQKLEDLGMKNSKLLLITSYLHLRRSKLCFDKAGLKVDVYFQGRSNEREVYLPTNYIVPSAGVLFEWNNLLHEWTGVLVYKIMGYA